MQVKKKLKILSTNLHSTILSNTTRAISTCVDGVLRAFCTDELVGPPEYFSSESIHCNDLLGPCFVSVAERKDEAANSSNLCTQDMIKELIYCYMDSSFPPIPEPKFQDYSISELLSTKEVFHALVQTLKENEVQQDSSFIDSSYVDEYLARTLVTKLEVKEYDDGYEQMTILGELYSSFLIFFSNL